MSPDPNGDSDGTYRVTSMYFDTARMRMRVYGEKGDDIDVTTSVELKDRIGRTMQKRRLFLPLRHAYRLCRGLPVYCFEEKRDAALAREVTALVESLGLEPSCVVSYVRRALVGEDDGLDLRVTFDHRIECRSPKHGMGVHPAGTTFVPDDWVVMEVKVNHAIPLWISELLSRHSCKLHELSKFRLASAHLSAAPGVLHLDAAS
jgi:hypothetical protein